MPIILQTWDTLVNTLLNPLSASVKSISDQTIKSLIAQSEFERENFKRVLIEQVVGKQKTVDKQRYVQVIQAMLIRMLDKLHSYKQNKELDNNLMLLSNLVSQHLEESLNFIEDFFSNYFDRNERVPASYLLISVEELSRQLQQLQERLELHPAIDRDLRDILVNNFEAFFPIKTSGPTYNELLYQKDLMSELLSDNALASESSIRDILFYFNFNDDDFVTYLFNKLQAVTEAYSSTKEKISALRYEQKTINQLRTKLHCYLSASMPSLKEQVNSWIEEEIKFLQTEPQPPTKVKTESETHDKIHTSLSVSKLALLIKLMVVDQVITNRVVAQVLRVVIRTVATSQSENIGFSSFESKYHKTDKGTITAVKDLLFRWINILNRL